MTFPEPIHFPSPSMPPQRSAEEGEQPAEFARRRLQAARELVIDLLAAYAALETRAMRGADPELKADIDRIRDIANLDSVGHDIHRALAEAQAALRRDFPPKR